MSAVCLIASCDTPQKQALRELAAFGVEPSGRALVRAVAERDIRTTGLLLESGVYTEQRDPSGRTPLGLAVHNRDFDSVAMLINAGANVNATLAGNASILGIAAEAGEPVWIETLLSAGARTDGLMPDGERILPWAIRRGRLDLIRTMMKADTDPHLKDIHGNPLLHVAMETGRRDLMETLIELGADPGAANAAGETTIQLALRQGWLDVIPKLAAAGADPNAPCPDGFTLLQRAVADRDVTRIILFLKIGADPHLPPGPGKATPFETIFEDPDPNLFEVFLAHHPAAPPAGWNAWLQRAYEKRDLGKSRLLLSQGAKPTSPGTDDRLLVEAAVFNRDADFVKLFLDYGLPPGRALWDTCFNGDHEMAGLLLAAGVPPEHTRIPSRETPLAVAIRLGHDRVAELLVQHGADPKLILPEGQRALHLAVARGCHRTLRQILATGGDPNAPFLVPVSPSFLSQVRPGVMRWVLKMDRNATPLMLAADSGNIQTARYLIKAGAKTGVRTRASALWPINFASRRSDVRMMRLFLGQDPHREERQIEIRLSEQKATMTDAEGKEIFSTKVSTGRRGYATPTGEFVITNKHRDWTSTLYHASMPYFQRLSCGDFGLHQGYVPGHPASHGCIRVPAGNAAKLFSMTKTGDRVRIVP